VWRSVTCNVVGPALLRWRGNRRFERIKGNHMAKKRKTKKTKIKCKRAWPFTVRSSICCRQHTVKQKNRLLHIIHR
jgi:hypothetical protein